MEMVSKVPWQILWWLTISFYSGNKAPVNRQKKTDRTTRLLITILLLFLATEFPQVRD